MSPARRPTILESAASRAALARAARRARRLEYQGRLVIRALARSGWRAVFALGAVGLGVVAAMVPLALGLGAEREMRAVSERLGRNLFMIVAGRLPVPPGRDGGSIPSPRLRLEDARRLQEGIPAIRRVVPLLEGRLVARHDGGELLTAVRAVGLDFIAVRGFTLAEGRWLDERDERERHRVAVVGSFLAARLNRGESLVGETIWIAGAPFLVVGQLAEKGAADDGQSEDDQILVPLGTGARRLWNAESLSRLLVETVDPESVAPARHAAREILRRSHRLDEGEPDDFEVLGMLRADAIRRKQREFLDGLAGLFAVLTLAMGGGGVLAVTWLNARDRAAEIGLRRAVGARRRDIAALVLAEAGLLGAAGGAAGLLAGALALAVLGPLAGWRLAIDVRGVLLPFLVGLAVSLAAALVPALAAARREPVAALRQG